MGRPSFLLSIRRHLCRLFFYPKIGGYCMLIQLPRQAQSLRLPKPQGKNAAWQYLKSIDGAAWLRRQFSWLASPFPQYLRNGKRVFCCVDRIGTTQNGKCLAYIAFPDAVFTIHYCSDWHRERHFGMAGPNAKKYRGKNADELGLTVKRFDVRYDERGKPFLRQNNYQHFIDL